MGKYGKLDRVTLDCAILLSLAKQLDAHIAVSGDFRSAGGLDDDGRDVVNEQRWPLNPVSWRQLVQGIHWGALPSALFEVRRRFYRWKRQWPCIRVQTLYPSCVCVCVWCVCVTAVTGAGREESACTSICEFATSTNGYRIHLKEVCKY